MGARIWSDLWSFGDILWHGDGDAPAIAVLKSRLFCSVPGSGDMSEFVIGESFQPVTVFSTHPTWMACGLCAVLVAQDFIVFHLTTQNDNAEFRAARWLWA
jgi:hypothetical protein